MGIFTKQPGAAERKQFDAAETRLQAVADRLGQVQRDLAQARAALAALRPGDALEDVEATAQAFAAEHGRLQARVVVLQHARERLTSELAQARRDLMTAESAVAAALQAHFRAAAEDRLARMANAIAGDVEPLLVELARGSGSPHDVFTLDDALAALKASIPSAGKVSPTLGIGLRVAEAESPKIPPPPRSALLDGDHRAGRHLNRLSPTVDLQAIRQNLADVQLEQERAEHQLFAAGRDVPAARRRDLETVIERCRQSADAYRAELAAAEQAQALAA